MTEIPKCPFCEKDVADEFKYVGNGVFRVLQTFTITSPFDIQEALDNGYIAKEEK